jgi:hypothetical protein
VTYAADQVKLNNANVFGQLVRYTGTGPSGGTLVGGTIPVSPNSYVTTPGVYQLSGDVSYNPITSRFMVAWEEYPGPDVMVRLFGTDGAPVTGGLYATAGPGGGGQGAPALAFDWERNRFFVVFTGDNPLVNGPFGVFGYLLDGSTGAVASSLYSLQDGFNIEPAVTFLPERDGFLPAWTGVSAGPRTANARFVSTADTAASLPDPMFVAMASSRSIGAPTLDYDAISRRILMGSMRDLDPAAGVIAGTIFDGVGTPLTGLFNMSTVAAASIGTLYPTIRAAEGGIIGMSYINDYALANFERFLLPSATPSGPVFGGGGGGGGGTTPVKQRIDLNGDGFGDAFIYSAATGSFSRQLSNGASGFSGSGGVWSPQWNPTAAKFAAHDVNDILLVNNLSGQWFKLINDGTSFTTQATGSWWPGWQRFVLDLDGDGLSDVFLYDAPSGQWFRCISTPSGFDCQVGFWSPGWEVTPLRLNADATRDFFLLNRTSGQWFWALSGGGGFSYPAVGGWDPDWMLHPGDFNGDGIDDLLLHRPATGRWFVALTGVSAFTYTTGTWTPGWNPKIMDLDANGTSDLFLHNPGTGQWFELLGLNGTFTAAGTGFWSTGWILHPTDLNNDGRGDMLLYNPATGVWFQCVNVSTGSFAYSHGVWDPGLTILVSNSQ